MDDGDYAYDCWKDKQLEKDHENDDDDDTTQPTKYGDDWEPPTNAPYVEPTPEDLNKDCEYWERLE
jgi:hypothetical protein